MSWSLYFSNGLSELGFEVIDIGTDSEDSVDYAKYGHMVGKLVSNKEVDKGIVICGSGIGISIAANKVKGIRAALCTSIEHAEMSRKHNDANIIAFGSRVTDTNKMQNMIEIFIFLSGIVALLSITIKFKRPNTLVVLFLGVFVFIEGTKWGMGVDWEPYKDTFDYALERIRPGMEPGFTLYVYTIRNITDNYTVYLLITSFLIIFGIMYHKVSNTTYNGTCALLVLCARHIIIII